MKNSTLPTLRVNLQVLPYLTQKARETFDFWRGRGLDADLALTVVESTLSEEEVFDLPPDEAA